MVQDSSLRDSMGPHASFGPFSNATDQQMPSIIHKERPVISAITRQHNKIIDEECLEISTITK